MYDYLNAYTADKSTPQTNFNDALRSALNARYWYSGVVDLRIFEEHVDEPGTRVVSRLEHLSLRDARRASLSIYRGTSRVTGENAFYVVTGNQGTLYADRETIDENHRRVRSPDKVTEVSYLEGYEAQWAAWAIEQEGLAGEDLDPELGGTGGIEHSPPTGEGPTVESVLEKRQRIHAARGKGEGRRPESPHDNPTTEKLCEECGEYHGRKYVEDAPNGEWRPHDPVFCICC